MGIIASGPGGVLAFSSASGGKVHAFNTITTAPVTIAPANPSRQKITFHNPGTNTIYVAPKVDFNGAALVVSTVLLGGCFIVLPGGLLEISGECQTAWQGFANTGSSNFLTVMDSNT